MCYGGLQVYHRPNAPAASQIESLVRQLAGDCDTAELPLFLEMAER
jgi:hypothetical protein